MRYRTAFPACLFLIASAATAAAQDVVRAAPSTRASAEVTFTLVDSAARVNSNPAMIRLDYGQPHLRGRAIHTDSLVPYDKPWRTGANNATTLDTDLDLVIGGKAVPSGKYVIETLPSRSGWKLLLIKEDAPAPAPDTPYNPASYFAVIDLRGSTVAAPVESLTMALIPARGEGAAHGELRISWGMTSQSVEWMVK